MCRYTIAKTLALFLGVLSVAARSLPERQSEIDVRSPGDVSDPKQHLEELGHVKVSEGVLDGNIHTATYSMSNNTTFQKRDALHYSCATACSTHDGDQPDPRDCEALGSWIEYKTEAFNPVPGTPLNFTLGTCTIAFVIPLGQPQYSYSFMSLGARGVALTNDCMVAQSYNYALCTFDHSGLDKPPYIVVANRI